MFFGDFCVVCGGVGAGGFFCFWGGVVGVGLDVCVRCVFVGCGLCVVVLVGLVLGGVNVDFGCFCCVRG